MKKFIKKTLFVATFSLASPVFASGIPVVDAASIAESVKQLTAMKEQIENQVKQITELKNQVTALTDGKNLGNVLKEAVTHAVPDDWQELYNTVNVDISKLTNPTTYDPNASLKNLANIEKMAQMATARIQPMLKDIEGLMSEINSSEGVKASTDLQNRISVQQAALALNQTQLDQMYRLYQINEQVIYEQNKRRDSCLLKTWDANNHGACSH
ncbi:type IV secretion system protein [Oligella urethralis]|uniref:type IV secretion system protein n=1 Tax=Oligella urethralis TaxID=90245 RepID=UPI00242B67A3|nr:type IV secretion system protein [Oligella urethralis]